MASLPRHDDVPLGSAAHCNSLPYRAPEVCLGASTNYPVDMWAYGCLLEEFAHLRISFPGKSVCHVIDNLFQRFGTPTPPHALTIL